MRLWMRYLEVILKSSLLKKQYSIATKYDSNGIQQDSLDINVSGSKYLSSLKDNFTITIKNLTYKEIIQIIDGQYYEVEIKCGYRDSNIFTLFKGSVLYVSNKYDSVKSNTVIILATSNLIAKFGQSKLNLNLNSGINMYNAIEFICRRAGIDNAYIDTDFKNKIIREVTECSSPIGNWMDTFANSNNFVVSSDSSNSLDLTIFNPTRKDARLIKLNRDMIVISSGYPTISSNGVNFTCLPSFNFTPGDTVQIDNSLIDMSVSSQSEVYQNKSFYLDSNQRYVIFEIDCELQNRGETFEFSISARSKTLMSSIGGGNNESN